MPRLFVVSDQADVTGLVRSLLGARVAAAKRDAAIAGLRRANPALDLDHLQPGGIIVLPDDLAEAGRAGDDPVRSAISDVVAHAEASVKELGAEVDRTEESRRAEADEARRLVASPELVRLAGRSPELKENLASVQRTLDEQDNRAAETQDALRRASEEWLADLAVLRDLTGN